MKRILEVGDIIKIATKDRKDAWLDYTVKIVEVTSRCAKGKKMFKDGSLSMLGYYRFNKNYDTEDLLAKPYG